MPTTGRRPYDTRDIAGYGIPDSRLSPPEGLSDAEKRAFMALITTTPTSQFTASDLPLMVRYCELQVLSERAAAELREADLIIVDAEGRPKANPIINIHAQATKGLSALCLRLKLSPQARSPKAPKRTVEVLSYYQQMALEEGDSDDETDVQPPPS